MSQRNGAVAVTCYMSVSRVQELCRFSRPPETRDLPSPQALEYTDFKSENPIRPFKFRAQTDPPLQS